MSMYSTGAIRVGIRTDFDSPIVTFGSAKRHPVLQIGQAQVNVIIQYSYEPLRAKLSTTAATNAHFTVRPDDRAMGTLVSPRHGRGRAIFASRKRRIV